MPIMASPAAGPAAAFPDPSRPGKYSIRLAHELSEERKPELRFFTTRGWSSSRRLPWPIHKGLTSFAVNHKPSVLPSHKRSSKVSRSTGNHEAYALAIEDVDNSGKSSQYEFTGHRAAGAPDESFVLVYQPDTRDYLLRPVEAEFDFNLTRASRDAHSHSKLRQIPRDHVQEVQSEHETDEDDNSNLFEDNPFSFHQYVDNIPRPRSPALASSNAGPKAMSVANSPLVAPSKTGAVKATPSKAAPAKKATPAATPKPVPKKPAKAAAPSKASAVPEEEEEKKKKPNPRSDAKEHEIPSVRLDRRASTRPAPDMSTAFGEDEDEDFTMLDTSRSSSPNRARHEAFRGTPKGTGPMSLSALVRSASPSSAGGTPSRKKPEAAGEEFEFGDDVEDDDVKSLALGSPITRPAEPAPAEEADDDDDDFDEDFDAAIQEAIQSEQSEAEDVRVAYAAGGEDEDESEEE